MEQELSILAYNNGNQITVGIYSVLTVILSFIELRVARFSQGTHIAGKVISSIFGITLKLLIKLIRKKNKKTQYKIIEKI